MPAFIPPTDERGLTDRWDDPEFRSMIVEMFARGLEAEEVAAAVAMEPDDFVARVRMDRDLRVRISQVRAAKRGDLREHLLKRAHEDDKVLLFVARNMLGISEHNVRQVDPFSEVEDDAGSLAELMSRAVSYSPPSE